MTAFRELVRQVCLVLGAGYVLFFFSERVFWSFWRPDDEAATFLGGWLLYSLFAYLVLVAIVWFRVRSFWSLVAVGAGFGWLGEGVFAMTLFGDPSMPFPFTIAWTGLAWHMPVVVIGLHMLRRTLLAPTVVPVFLTSAGLGLFWGFWAISWGLETPPVEVDAWQFLSHAAPITIGLAVAHLAIDAGRPECFQPTRWGVAISLLLVAAFLGLVTIPTVPWSPAVLLPLAGLLFLGLQRNRSRSPDESYLDDWRGPVRPVNLAALAAMPFLATAVYCGLTHAGWLLPAHQIVAFSFAPIGLCLLLMALVTLLMPRKAR